MVNYREILRLTSLGYTQRQITASVHSSRSTISEVQELAKKADLSFQLDESVTNEILLMTFYPERITATNPRVEPDYSYIHKELAKPGVNLESINGRSIAKLLTQMVRRHICTRSSVISTVIGKD